MSFSNRLRQLAKPIWDAQLTHPFVVALGNGTLPERKFKYYILQDAKFLGDLARVFSAGALRAPDSESALRLTKLAEETIVVELCSPVSGQRPFSSVIIALLKRHTQAGSN